MENATLLVISAEQPHGAARQSQPKRGLSPPKVVSVRHIAGQDCAASGNPVSIWRRSPRRARVSTGDLQRVAVKWSPNSSDLDPTPHLWGSAQICCRTCLVGGIMLFSFFPLNLMDLNGAAPQTSKKNNISGRRERP